MKPFLVMLLIVEFSTPSWAEPLRVNLLLSQTLNLPQPPPKRDSLINGIVIGAIVGVVWCAVGPPAQGYENSAELRTGVFVGAGVGALLGGYIDYTGYRHARRPGVLFRVRF
jgi:hypothetical protein